MRPEPQAPQPSRPQRLAVVVSHPIQHFVPFYRQLAKDAALELRVIYCSRIGLRRYFDKDMGVELEWKMDLLSGYDHVFLPEADRITATSTFSVDNPSVVRELERFQPDIVKVNGYSQLTALRTLFWCWRNHVPAVMWSDSELLHQRNGWRRLFKAAVLPVIYKRFAAFLTVGDNNEAYLRHYGVPPEKMFRTPFTIDESSFAPVRAHRPVIRATLRQELAIPQDAFVALFVGKLIERKRPQDLVRAVESLTEQAINRPVHALFAGNGPMLAELKQLAAARGAPCTFAGFVNVDLLPRYYGASDVLVHPAENDPHPLVTSEAAYLGLPLVLSDRVGCIGPTDTARDGENTAVFPCANIPALAEHLRRLAKVPAHYSRMSAASLRIAAELDISRSVRGCRQAALALAAAS
jgi:glycosyltransferase involved in cell wall biosynthesis